MSGGSSDHSHEPARRIRHPAIGPRRGTSASAFLGSAIFTATVDASTVDASTIHASTIDASTINTSTINTSTIDSSAIDASTINASAIDASTVNTSTINTATMTSIATLEREKYEGIYATPDKYPKYGHSNHGRCAMPIVQRWFAESAKSQGGASPAGPSLVDIGCGWNEFCQSLRAEFPGIHAVGVDFACPGSDVTSCATELPFADGQFDVLTAFDMLEHVLPAQVDAVLAEFARVSRRFIFSVSYQPSVTTWKGENLHPTVRPESWWLLRILHAGGCRIEKRGRYITGEWQLPLKIAPEANVILVGNGPSVLTHHGSRIDAFDEIVRFNTYHIDGFEQHTGTRTTLWSTFGRGQLPGCDQRPDRVIGIHGENGATAYAPRELYRIPIWFYNETRSYVQRRAWWMGGFAVDPSHLLATSGLIVASWLLQVVGVKKITLAGFDHFSKENSRQHHYWLPQAFGKPREHDGAVEASIFAELRERGRIDYF